MNRRTKRIGSLIRQVIGQLLLDKISDPRIDPARTSVVNVEVSDDLLRAKVYVSVMGTENRQRLAIRALQHAAGHIQELMMKQIKLRCTPILSFESDAKFKKTLETLEIIKKVSDELRAKDADENEPEDNQELQ